MKYTCCFPIALLCAAVLTACGGGGLNPTKQAVTSTIVTPHLGATRNATAIDFKVLHAFSGPPDGAFPNGGLIAVGRKLYGTTTDGGYSACYMLGCGTVFSVDPSGRENVVYKFKGHSFGGQRDGAGPQAGLTLLDGRLFGTTAAGGQVTYGTAYTVGISGTERVLYSFVNTRRDGAYPVAPMIAFGGTLYGTTERGGHHVGCGQRQTTCGTVFSLNTNGNKRVLHYFRGAPDGGVPATGFAALAGKLYGTTVVGGYTGNGDCATYGCGVVYAIDASGDERVLYKFRGGHTGTSPNGLIAVNGVLYGTTPGNAGIFFSLTPSGKLKTLYTFDRQNGTWPNDTLIYWKGNFYGTTQYGAKAGVGCGRVFRISPSGDQKILHAFSGRGPDGCDPSGPLYVFHGRIYGTTELGGVNCGSTSTTNFGCGTIFSLKP